MNIENDARVAAQRRPHVSVVLPVFNAGAELHSTFDQLAQLTYPRLEIIVIDDGSTDATLEIVKGRIQEDRRVRLITLDTNRGPGPARTAGLHAATGRYVWFVDWDDQWAPTILDVLVDAAESRDADVVACRGRWRRGGVDGSITDGLPHAGVCSSAEAFDLVLGGKLKGYLWTKLFRRDVIPADAFPDIRTSEDLCAVVRVIAQSRRVVCIPDVLYFHVIRGGSLTNATDPPLENLAYARSVVRSVSDVAVSASRTRRARLLLHYDYAYWYVAHATTAVRLASSVDARNAVAWARRQMKFRDIVRVARVSALTATKATAVKTLGSRFPDAYESVRAVRRRTVRSD